MAYRVSLVMPAWNEQDTIRRRIRLAQAALAELGAEHEIIVVDDGSSDNTAALVRAEATANPCVRLIRHPHRMGLTAVFRTGFKASTCALIALTDFRCSFEIQDMAYLLPLSQRHDVICGYRAQGNGPIHRRFLSWAYGNVFSLATGCTVRNPDSPVKIFHREQLASILPDGPDCFAGSEMLARAKLEGLSVAEVGLQGRSRLSKPAKTPWLGVPKKFCELLRFYWSRLLFPSPSVAPQCPRGWFWVGLLILAFVTGLLLFGRLSYPLLEPDEGRYAEVAREMLTSGEWIVPTLNQQPFYDKPPVFYWLLASSFRLFGTNEWAARIVPASAAFLIVISLYVFGRSIVGTRPAFLAALALTLTIEFTQIGRIVILDSLLTLFVALSLFMAYEALQGRHLRWSWWIASVVCCALGVLIKGPIALVLFVPPVAAYVWLNQDRARLTLVHWCVYLGLVFGLVAPIYTVVIARDPQFAYRFFVDQHLIRFLMHEYHVEPWWYYVPVLLIGCLPWSLLLFPFARFLFSRLSEVRALRPQSMGFFFLWGCWCVVFFSLSSSKLPTYIFPALPAIAMLVGCYLDHVLFQPLLGTFFQQARDTVPRLGVAALAIAWLVGSFVALRLELISLSGAILQGVMSTAFLIGLLLWRKKLSAKVAWLVCGGMAAIVVLQVTHQIVPAWSELRSPLKRYPEISDMVRDGKITVACYGAEWGSIPFYLGRDDLVVNMPDVPAGKLHEILIRKHNRYLIVVRQRRDLDLFREAMGPDMEIAELMTAGGISVALVNTVTSVEDEPPSE